MTNVLTFTLDGRPEEFGFIDVVVVLEQFALLRLLRQQREAIMISILLSLLTTCNHHGNAANQKHTQAADGEYEY